MPINLEDIRQNPGDLFPEELMAEKRKRVYVMPSNSAKLIKRNRYDTVEPHYVGNNSEEDEAEVLRITTF